MAPREANPNFADQYLCVDYDGIGLLPNDPSPPMQLESEDEDEIAANIAAATAAAAALSNNNGNNHTGAADQLLLTLDHSAAEVIPAPIDPLSIDPTSAVVDTASAMNANEIVSPGAGDLLFSSLLSSSSAEVTAGSFSFAVTPDHSSTSTNITRTRLLSSNAAAPQHNAFHFYTARRHHDTDATVLSDDSPQLMEDSSMDDADPAAVTTVTTSIATVSDLGMTSMGGAVDTPINVRRIADHGHFHLSAAAASITSMSTVDDHHAHSNVDHADATSSSNAVMVSAAHHQPILNFGPNTTLTDLKYFAERGCIVPLLYALKTPKLTALGARLLADYAKNPTRRVAVAGNKRILEFTLRTMQGAVGIPPPSNPTTSTTTSTSAEGSAAATTTGIVTTPEAVTASLDPQQRHLEESFRERAVEYAVETIRSLTATEESDVFLMNTPDLMVTLAVVARGGGTFEWKENNDMAQHHHSQQPFSIPFSSSTPDTTPPRNRSTTSSNTPPPRTLLHAASTGAVPLATTLSRRDMQTRPISRSISTASTNSQSSAADVHTATSMEDATALPRPNSRITSSPTNNSSNIISPHSVIDANLATTDPGRYNTTRKVSFNSKARLHACIAIMNLSCGKANKIEIAKIPQVLSAMRDVMMEAAASPTHHASETRLKATTCIKNLSNADANDSALLNSPKLIEALGHVILVSLRDNYLNNNHHNSMSDEQERETSRRRLNLTVTNACLALMNLSIAKANKRRVFRTPGVMEALMAVITKGDGEARVKSCSALSNLAIGYDNKIPMFHYPGFVEAILHVIETDQGEARTKACSIIWSFAAEMRNQVPVRINKGI
jgi:hypothetical protein